MADIECDKRIRTTLLSLRLLRWRHFFPIAVVEWDEGFCGGGDLYRIEESVRAIEGPVLGNTSHIDLAIDGLGFGGIERQGD